MSPPERPKMTRPLTWPAYCPKCNNKTFYFASVVLKKVMLGSCSTCKETFEVEIIGVEDE